MLLCCIVLLGFFLFFFLIFLKTTQCNNTIHNTIYSFLENNTIPWTQYNTITKYNFCKKNLLPNCIVLLCCIVLYCVVVFSVFFFWIIMKQHNTIDIYNFTNSKEKILVFSKTILFIIQFLFFLKTILFITQFHHFEQNTIHL